jgi:hypothetical protein
LFNLLLPATRGTRDHDLAESGFTIRKDRRTFRGIPPHFRGISGGIQHIFGIFRQGGR